MAKLKILYIEDDKSGEAGAKVLEMLGYEVVLVTNFSDAKLRYTSEQPDIVLTDHTYPGGNGFEFIDFVRNGNRPEVPVIWHSGGDLKLDDAIKAGANYAFHKPLDFFSVLGPLLSDISQQISRKTGF